MREFATSSPLIYFHSQWCLGILALSLSGMLTGCPTEESPFKSENETLRKQHTKQESVIQSLQDGNQVMQQQIDLLNRELREAQGKTKVAEAQLVQTTTQGQELSKQLQKLGKDNKKLTAQFNWIKKKSSQAKDSISVRNSGGQTRELLHPVKTASQAAQEALSHNGYSLLVSIGTETKSVFVTERKISAPRSLETAGFRNQYVLSLNALPSKGTLLTVKADFEKMGQGGRVLGASKEETADIERRLIVEISKKLEERNKPRKK